MRDAKDGVTRDETSDEVTRKTRHKMSPLAGLEAFHAHAFRCLGEGPAHLANFPRQHLGDALISFDWSTN